MSQEVKMLLLMHYLMYSNDSPGTEHACSEFMVFDIIDDDLVALMSNIVLLAGIEAMHQDSRLT